MPQPILSPHTPLEYLGLPAKQGYPAYAGWGMWVHEMAGEWTQLQQYIDTYKQLPWYQRWWQRLKSQVQLWLPRRWQGSLANNIIYRERQFATCCALGIFSESNQVNQSESVMLASQQKSAGEDLLTREALSNDAVIEKHSLEFTAYAQLNTVLAEKYSALYTTVAAIAEDEASSADAAVASNAEKIDAIAAYTAEQAKAIQQFHAVLQRAYRCLLTGAIDSFEQQSKALVVAQSQMALAGLDIENPICKQAQQATHTFFVYTTQPFFEQLSRWLAELQQQIHDTTPLSYDSERYLQGIKSLRQALTVWQPLPSVGRAQQANHASDNALLDLLVTHYRTVLDCAEAQVKRFSQYTQSPQQKLKISVDKCRTELADIKSFTELAEQEQIHLDILAEQRGIMLEYAQAGVLAKVESPLPSEAQQPAEVPQSSTNWLLKKLSLLATKWSGQRYQIYRKQYQALFQKRREQFLSRHAPKEVSFVALKTQWEEATHDLQVESTRLSYKNLVEPDALRAIVDAGRQKVEQAYTELQYRQQYLNSFRFYVNSEEQAGYEAIAQEYADWQAFDQFFKDKLLPFAEQMRAAQEKMQQLADAELQKFNALFQDKRLPFAEQMRIAQEKWQALVTDREQLAIVQLEAIHKVEVETPQRGTLVHIPPDGNSKLWREKTICDASSLASVWTRCARNIRRRARFAATDNTKERIDIMLPPPPFREPDDPAITEAMKSSPIFLSVRFRYDMDRLQYDYHVGLWVIFNRHVNGELEKDLDPMLDEWQRAIRRKAKQLTKIYHPDHYKTALQAMYDAEMWDKVKAEYEKEIETNYKELQEFTGQARFTQITAQWKAVFSRDKWRFPLTHKCRRYSHFERKDDSRICRDIDKCSERYRVHYSQTDIGRPTTGTNAIGVPWRSYSERFFSMRRALKMEEKSAAESALQAEEVQAMQAWASDEPFPGTAYYAYTDFSGGVERSKTTPSAAPR
jgi:hypothetical protein